MNKTNVAPAPRGNNRSREQTITYNEVNICSDDRAQTAWQHPERQEIYPSQSRLLSTACKTYRIYLKPTFPPPLFPPPLNNCTPFPPPPSSSYMELTCHFWMSHVLSLIHTLGFSPEPRMLFYPFFQNSNYPQGSAQMSPLQQNQPQPPSQN